MEVLLFILVDKINGFSLSLSLWKEVWKKIQNTALPLVKTTWLILMMRDVQGEAAYFHPTTFSMNTTNAMDNGNSDTMTIESQVG